MSFADYIAGIKFRFIKPHTPLIPLGFDRITQRLRLGVFLEILNTKLVRCERETKHTLRAICNIPKMSTFAIGALVCEGVSRMPYNHVFVNVGVWHGFTFLSGMAGNGQRKCIGVDNFSEFGGPRRAFLKRFNASKAPVITFMKWIIASIFPRFIGSLLDSTFTMEIIVIVTSWQG